MYSNSENTFITLMRSNNQVKNLIYEIAKLDADLENLKKNHSHLFMMDQKIHRIEYLTAQAGQFASEYDGGDAYEHASWLSYNVHRLISRPIRDPFTGTDLKPYLSDSRNLTESTGCLLNIILLVGVSLFLSVILFGNFIYGC